MSEIMSKRIRFHRSGQPGNRNARKHGLYTNRRMLKPAINYSIRYSARSAGTIQPQIVPDVFDAIFRNQSSLNPNIRTKSAGTIEAANI
jgi:hypothetical protein